MAASNISVDVHDHGVALDVERRKVQCNYCGKVVSGFYRLKCHLGGIRGDVVPCDLVPLNVKCFFSTKVQEVKRKNIVKNVDQLQHPDIPLKRSRNIASLNDKESENEVSVSASSKKERETSASGEDSRRGQDLLHDRRLKPNFKEVLRSKTTKGLKPQVSLSKESEQCIGRFLFETGVEFSSINSSNFCQMINIYHKQGEGVRKPTCMELKGFMLREEVKFIREYVKKVKDSWSRTGCSILADEWADVRGRDLVNFLVDSPKGIIYIKSSSLSAYVGDVDALRVMLEELIEKVGAENVVQIIISSDKSQMWTATSQIVEQHKKISSTLDASYYIQIILEHMEKMDPFNEIVNKVKTFTRFIHGNPSVLKLFRCYSPRYDLVKSHKMRSVMSYLSLRNVVSQEQKLKELFASSEWTNSIWASSMEAKWAADLVCDASFWRGANTLLVAATPFVRILQTMDGTANKLQVGYIYEIFRQAKEEIRSKMGKKSSNYMPFWNVVDKIWHIYLHPLHCAGFYLNPCLFFTKTFYSDSVIERGLKCCIENMVEEPDLRVLIYQQLEEYERGKGAFKAASSVEAIKDISPAQWWFCYGEKYPELQNFAIRVLSQTCEGALRCGLRRRLAEKLLTNGRNFIEQQRLKDLTFLHYNMQLQSSKFGEYNNIVVEEKTPTKDCTVTEVIETMSHRDYST